MAVRPGTTALNPTERILLSTTEPAPVRKSLPVVDFDLDDFDADEEVLLDFDRQVGIGRDMLTPLAEHHSTDGVHSYYVLFDGSVTWGVPGTPQLMALHLQRDRDKRTFIFEGNGCRCRRWRSPGSSTVAARPTPSASAPSWGHRRRTRRRAPWSAASQATATTTPWATPTPATTRTTCSPSWCCALWTSGPQPVPRPGRRGRHRRVDPHPARGWLRHQGRGPALVFQPARR